MLLESELKELAKRDTNEFLRESKEPKKDFEDLMKSSKLYEVMLVESLPNKQSAEFEAMLKRIFGTLTKKSDFIREDVFDSIHKRTKISVKLLRKKFAAHSYEERLPQSETTSSQVSLGRYLIRQYTNETGVVSTPQRPLGEIIEHCVSALHSSNYQFILDSSADSLIMVKPCGSTMLMELSNSLFRSWALDTFQLSTVDREPVKDLVKGLVTVMKGHEHTRIVKNVKFYDYRQIDGSVVCAFATGNQRNQIIVVQPSDNGLVPKVSIEPNVVNQWNFVLASPSLLGSPINYVEGINNEEAMALMKRVLFDFQALSEEDKLRSFCHKIQMLFPVPTNRKMRKANRGMQGSEKSTDADIFTSFVYGVRANGAYNDEKELWSVAHNNPVQSIDNWEGLKKRKQEEFALLHATGQRKSFRKLYTDNSMLVYHPRSHLIETAIEGFGSPESAEREQTYHFDKVYQVKSDAIVQIENLLRTKRDLIYSAFFNVMSTELLPSYIKKYKDLAHLIKDIDHPKKRFDDFIVRQALMADLVRKHWKIGYSNEELLKKWTAIWSKESIESSINLDPLLQRLEIIFNSFKYCDPESMDDRCLFRERIVSGVSARELFTMVCIVEKDHHLPKAYSSTQVLAQRLTSACKIWDQTLGSCGFDIKDKIKIYWFEYGKVGKREKRSSDGLSPSKVLKLRKMMSRSKG